MDGKIAYLPDGSPRFVPEYEACRQAADRLGLRLADVMAAARQAFQSENDPS